MPVTGVLTVAAILWSGAMVTPVTAQEPPRLQREVTDEVGALEGGHEALEARLADVRERDGVHMFALYTDSTGTLSVTDFADEVAAASSLGGNDALLVVALEDRTYALWVGDTLGQADDEEVDRVLAEEVEPRLTGGDYAGAALAAAERLGRAPTTPAGGGPGGDPAPGPPIIPMLLLLAGIALVGAVAVQRVRERQGHRRAAEERDRRTGELARRANTLLVASDEAVRDAGQELGFAEAQFRPADVQPFRAALEDAREVLHEAFALRQRLDDTDDETPDEREQVLLEIVAHTERVDALLAAEHARLDQLRDVERNAPELLADLDEHIADLDRHTEACEGSMAELRQLAARSSAAVEGNLAEARKATRAAEQAVRQGIVALEQGESGTAGACVREAQEAVAKAGELLASVERLAASATQAERDLETELRAAAADVEAAAEALASRRVRGLDAPLAEARSLLQQAEAENASGERDVVEAYRLAVAANAAADQVLAGVRDAEDLRARQQIAAEQALKAAETAYVRASDYLASRRQGVGRHARTRLQEAERHLDRARSLVADSAVEAAAEAGKAERLADDAYRLAQRDFSDYDRYQGPFGRGPFGGGGHRGSTIVIGGFPIPIGGSSRGGGGWGGSTWGSPGGRSRGGGFGGGFGGGRSRGGGFGGGRSRGGRF